VLAILNIGPFELLLLSAAAVLLFGGDLPEVARKAAAMAGRLRAMTTNLTREMQSHGDFKNELRRPPELDLDARERGIFPEDWKPPAKATSSDAGEGEDANADDADAADESAPTEPTQSPSPDEDTGEQSSDEDAPPST
jgi:Sec-independent protein translocase protein TatA